MPIALPARICYTSDRKKVLPMDGKPLENDLEITVILGRGGYFLIYVSMSTISDPKDTQRYKASNIVISITPFRGLCTLYD